jgi:hypothetical protein
MMLDTIYELYVKYSLVRWIYQLGILFTWAVWAQASFSQKDATWLVFGWLPAVFWPIQAIAYGLSLLFTQFRG